MIGKQLLQISLILLTVQMVVCKNAYPTLLKDYEFSKMFESAFDEETWLTNNLDATAWFSFASWKFGNLTQMSGGIQEFNSSFYLTRLYFLPFSWGYANDTVMVAKTLYFLGPEWKHFEPDLPDSYYIACGNALITLWAHMRGMQCSLASTVRYILWTNACYFHSVAYEGFERVPSVRGKFGLGIVSAMILSVAPYLVFIIAIGVLNYVIMGRVMEKAEEGSTLYHRVEVCCDLATAMINVIHELDFGVLFDWLNYFFTGRCLNPRSIMSWWSVHYMLRNIINDLGIIALALLAEDKRQAVTDPMEYMTAEKRPVRRIILALALVCTATGIRCVGSVLQQNEIFDNSGVNITAGLSEVIRGVYTLVCLYLVVRSSIFIAKTLRQLKSSKKKKNKPQEDMPHRIIALTLQTCLLNGLSLCIFALGAIVSVFVILFALTKNDHISETIQEIYSLYFLFPEYFMVIMSSNIGFIVHCYYSKMYREAAREVFEGLQKKLKGYARTCGLSKATNIVDVA